jgi:NADPH-dependent ferric siderophore reductase
MPDATSPIEVVNHPYAFRLLQVQRTNRITPHMVRVTLGGDALEGFRSDAPDDGSRLFFPPDPTDGSWAPTVEGTGLIFPDGVTRPPGREYTPRRYDPLAGELDFDFVVHGDGPASTWAANAQPGHYLGVSGPRRSRMLDYSTVDWFLLAGDETALPSIGRRLEELPAGMPAFVVIELSDPADEQQLTSQANMTITWVQRSDAEPDTSDLLSNAVRDLTLPDGQGFAWAAGEAASLRSLRRHLLDEREITQEWMRMTGYWKRAIANWDHHQPLD